MPATVIEPGTSRTPIVRASIVTTLFTSTNTNDVNTICAQVITYVYVYARTESAFSVKPKGFIFYFV
jgi:hypothetical protein